MGVPLFDGHIKIIRCSFCKLSKTGKNLSDFENWTFGVSTVNGVVLCPLCFRRQTGQTIQEVCEGDLNEEEKG